MAKASILIIEDDPDIRELVVFNLGREGYTVLQAATGEEGLKLAAQSKPDVIVLDVMLPGLDGLEVLRRLKADSGSPPHPGHHEHREGRGLGRRHGP